VDDLGLVDVHGCKVIAAMDDAWPVGALEQCRLRLETFDCGDVVSPFWL
jgi:hypothetical protein